MKRTITIPFAWVLKGDDEDKLWAEQYIREKGRTYVSNNVFTDLASLMLFVDQWRSPFSIREFEAVMRNTWRQRQARKNSPGKKSYNYTFSSATKRRLDALADDLHLGLTDTLEDLINQGARQQEQHATEKKQAAEKNKKQLEHVENDLTAARQALKELLDEFEKHLMRWSLSVTEKQQPFLITNYPLTEEQLKKAAHDLCQKEMQRIAAQLHITRMIRQLPPTWQNALRKKTSDRKGSSEPTNPRNEKAPDIADRPKSLILSLGRQD